ncbi:M56 family metallopeptidase [Changchengzhania lutea]|uniref:M56 family metallopeptidase n=1 Tax=Changchengzhania lutea TaxID=2049305 RepID=UPI00115D8294|nr:M56 family metallopeptidase [Changchengzhania lutea]
MIPYIIQTVVFQLFFLVIYDAFLKKETFFNYNRFYLLITTVLSLIIPFIKIDGFKNVVSDNFIIALPEVFIGQKRIIENNAASLISNSTATSMPLWEIVMYSGMAVAGIIFLYKFIEIVALIINNPKIYEGNFTLVTLLKSTVAFSFFNYIFLGELIDTKDKDAILKHEHIHAKEKHSLDLLFFEFLRIIFWFNPLVYMYQQKIMTVHEFIADANAIKKQNKQHYYQNLLSQVFETKNVSFINPFFKQSLIKKRIVMLSKSKSKQVNLFKYALLVPIILGMLIYTSCSENSKSVDENSAINEEVTTEIIEKIKAVKNQIQIQGDINETEERGLGLLTQIMKESELNPELVKSVNDYNAMSPKTELVKKISAVFDEIQIHGELSDADVKAIKGLLVLTNENGLNDPFFSDVLNDVDIPFGIIDEVPVFPGCESLTNNEERKKCMSRNISDHVNKNFNIKLANTLNLTGRQRINVIFKIDNQGNITGVKSRAPHPELEAEAIRVIKTLPKMIPGEHQGKKVNVPYSLPIIFEIDEGKL